MSEDYSLTSYLTAINWSKKKLMDTDDETWQKNQRKDQKASCPVKE